MPLTDPACKNARCPEGKLRLRLADAGGLYLEVLPNGSKLWRWKYRFAGKEKRLALGSYSAPAAEAVSLKDARIKRDAAREQVRAGTDPAAQRKAAKRARAVAHETSFEKVARAWWERWSTNKSERHAAYTLRRLEADVFPGLGNRPIAEIEAPDLVDLVLDVERRGANDIARRIWQTCGQVFEHALTLKGSDGKPLLKRNPARDLRPSAALKPRTKGHYARVEAKDLPELLRKMHAYEGAVFTRYALQLMALTFVRTTELIATRWEEFDLDAAEWRIPAERMKMATPHVVPLSTQALDALRCLKEHEGLHGWLFPNERDHEKPMSNGAILMALKRMGYGGRMTGHGFRGVASTLLHEHGFEHAHIELQLAHMDRDDVSAAYNFATYLPQRRQMMQWYADQLDALRQGAKIIPLRAA